MDQACEHLLSIPAMAKPAGGCDPCLERGDTWVHLRFCVTCGAVGCCDQSKNRHARAHAATGHPVARSKEPGEMWAWCYADEMGVEVAVPETWA